MSLIPQRIAIDRERVYGIVMTTLSSAALILGLLRLVSSMAQRHLGDSLARLVWNWN
jgi:hypothetical protein